LNSLSISNKSDNDKIESLAIENENLEKRESDNNIKSIKLKSINLKANSAIASSRFSTSENDGEDYFFPNQNENIYSKKYYIIDNDTEKIIERIPVESWKSTNIIIQLLKDTLEDLINDNGIEYKTMINAFIENKEKEKISALIKDENIKESSRREELKNDPIVKLIEKLENCKNRNERKRLLAEFNKNVGFGWGEYKKIPKINENDFDLNYQDEFDEKNNSNNNSQKVYKQIADESKSKNSNNQNTIVYSEKRIRKIYSDSKKANFIGSKFTQKINVKNQKIKELENQKRLSLMLNDESTDRSYVKIPGLDYEKALSYIGENETDKIKNFTNLIEEKKKEYSIDLKNYVGSKKGKTDQLIDKSNKITLLQLEKLEARKMLENKTNNHEKVLLDFEMKLGKNNLLENKYPVKNELINYETSLKESNNNGNHYENDIMIFEESSNNLSFAHQSKNGDMKSIQFKKLNLNKNNKLEENESNIALYKQENQLTKHTIKLQQEKSKVNKVLKNKHIYQSMNYYKNNELDYLAYERDPNTMNALKFKKAIKKDKYYYERDEQINNKNNNLPENN